MKVYILRNTIADGVPVAAGSVLTLSEKTGRDLITAGKAELYAETKPAKKGTRTK